MVIIFLMMNINNDNDNNMLLMYPSKGVSHHCIAVSFKLHFTKF